MIEVNRGVSGNHKLPTGGLPPALKRRPEPVELSRHGSDNEAFLIKLGSIDLVTHYDAKFPEANGLEFLAGPTPSAQACWYRCRARYSRPAIGSVLVFVCPDRFLLHSQSPSC